MFGAAFDASCLLWQDTCGDRGSCFQYDNSRLALLIFTICEVLKVVSVICMLLAWYLYKPPKDATILECEVKADDIDKNEPELKENGYKKQVELDQSNKGQINRSLSDDSVKDFFSGTHVDEVTLDKHSNLPNGNSNNYQRDYMQDDTVTYL